MAGKNRNQVSALLLAVSLSVAGPIQAGALEIEEVEVIEEVEAGALEEPQVLSANGAAVSGPGLAEPEGIRRDAAGSVEIVELDGGRETALSAPETVRSEPDSVGGAVSVVPETIQPESVGGTAPVIPEAAEPESTQGAGDSGLEIEEPEGSGTIIGIPEVIEPETTQGTGGSESETVEQEPESSQQVTEEEPGSAPEPETAEKSGGGTESETAEEPGSGPESETAEKPGGGTESETAEEPGSGPESETAEKPGNGTEPETAEKPVSGTESETAEEPVSEPESETAEPVSEPESETVGQREDQGKKKVYLGIDNRHRYEGMEQSFSDGYQPEIQDGILYLTVPFTASGPLEKDRLTVDLTFAEKENSPFVFKNYQKTVKKKRYVLKDGIMTESSAVSKESPGRNGSAGESSGGKKESGVDSGGKIGGGTDSGGKKESRADSGGKNGAGADSGAEGQEDRSEAYLYLCQIPLQEAAAPGQYSLTVKAWGYSAQQEKVSLKYQIFVRVPQAPEPENGSGGGSTGGGGYSGGGGGYSGGREAAEEIIRQPKMLLENSSFAGQELEAGSREHMEISFRNRSESQSMYNLKVVASTDAPGVELSRNSFYFSRVEPGGEISLEGELGIAMDASAGTVPMNFTFEYEDKKGNAATGTETVFLSVAQPVRMEFEASELPAVLYASDTVELSLKALNLSRTGVYNVRVHLSGDGLFPVQDVFVGNMEAGTEGSGVMEVYVGTRTMERIGLDAGESDEEKYGPVSGTLTLEYEDERGETHQMTRDYQTEIKKAQILSLKVEEEEEANSWWISVFVVIIAGLFLLVLLLFLRLRRKTILLEEMNEAQKEKMARQ